MNGKADSRTLYALFLSLALLISCDMAAIALDDYFQSGKQSYAAGNFKTAADFFRRACIARPDNAELHYYFANALSKLNERSQAIVHYKTCLMLNPSGDLALYARTALSSYFAPAGLGVRAASKPNPVELAGSQGRIAEQALEKDNALVLRTAQLTSDISQSDDVAASRFDQQGAELAAEMSKQMTVTSKHGSSKPVYSNNEITSATQEFRDKSDSIRNMEMKEILQTQANADKQRQELNDAAISLQDLLESKNLDGSRLSPTGTNLYVRNYVQGK